MRIILGLISTEGERPLWDMEVQNFSPLVFCNSIQAVHPGEKPLEPCPNRGSFTTERQ